MTLSKPRLETAAFLLAALAGNAAAADPAPPVALRSSSAALIETSCLRCHDAQAEAGLPRLDTLPLHLTTVEAAERWQRVLAVLNSGEMPPADAAQPSAEAKAEFLADLSVTLAKARKSLGDEGQIGGLRRLNRREYANTIEDLLGVSPDLSALPDDKGTGTFDTIGSSLFLSSDQLEAYLAIARAAVAAALAEQRSTTSPRVVDRLRRETERDYQATLTATVRRLTPQVAKLWRWELNDRQPTLVEVLGVTGPAAEHDARFIKHRAPRDFFFATACLALPQTQAGSYLANAAYSWHPSNEHLVVPPTAPPGDYVLRARLAAVDRVDDEAAKNASRNRPTPRFVEFVVLEDGDRNRPRVIGVEEVTGNLDTPATVELRLHLSAGSQRHFALREKRFSDAAAVAFRHNAEIDRGNAVGTLPGIWCDWVEWEGPLLNPDRAILWQQILGNADTSAADEATVRGILSRFATRAFRGVTADPAFLDRLVALQVQRQAAGGDLLDSLVEPLAIILASPGFLYLHDPAAEPANDVASRPPAAADRLLSEFELASRLSYFLWAGPPDEPLLAAARAGELQTPAGLSGQVDRMVADPRSLRFVVGFVHQWLGLDRLDFFQFDFRNFPDFDESTREAARQEVYHTCQLLLREDLDARRLLANDFVVVNSLLAAHYGLTDGGRPVAGMQFRKVMLPETSERGGLLGMAAILAMGSNGSHTSPVERGAWVLRKLLNDPPPPAPANVPQLSRIDSRKLTVRERLLAHQELPQCGQCHRKIDPLGFGLENFDAVGLWRTVDTYKPGEYLERDAAGNLLVTTYPIDPAGRLHGGPSFADFFELRRLIATHDDRFLRGLVENLLAYALGRPTSFADAEAVEAIVAAAQADGAGFKSIVTKLVTTPEFRTK